MSWCVDGEPVFDMAEEILRRAPAHGAFLVIAHYSTLHDPTVRVADAIRQALPPPNAREQAALDEIQTRARLRPTQGRPLRVPHHTASEAALVGTPRGRLPGEVELATHGVLVLSDLYEFRLAALEGTVRVIQQREEQSQAPDIVIATVRALPRTDGEVKRLTLYEKLRPVTFTPCAETVPGMTLSGWR